ncbi:MAG: PD-(D/E)XK nuclease family transposase, partial [Cytophagales bacterium]|nr:PD-(D/E)XK nuclease family transposase [Cytophagales bacterium]
FTFVELPKFKKLIKEEGRSLQELTLEEKWYYFLIHAASTTNEERGILSTSTEIKEAYKALSYHDLTGPERRSYESAEKNRLDELAIRDKLQEEATQKGIEMGKKEAIKEGIEMSKIAIAQTMLAAGESVDKIQKWTGLSLEQINALK